MAKRGWCGGATVDLTITRWQHRFTGEVRVEPPKEAAQETPEDVLGAVHEEKVWEELEWPVEVTGSAWSEPDSYWEPGDAGFEVDEVKTDCPVVKNWDDLTEAEQNEAEGKLFDNARDDGGDCDPPDDWD